jgi:heat shock protein HslJ
MENFMDVAVLPRGNASRSMRVSRSMRGWLAFAGLLLALAPPATAQPAFPFEQEMLLDVRPLPGSRRVPMLEIAASGRAQIDLWCHSGLGLVEVAGTTIKFTLGAMREEVCTPERTQRDEDLVAALAEVTQWRVEGDAVVLIGPKELHYRLSTH